MLFYGDVLVGYDNDSESMIVDEMVENGTLVLDKKLFKYRLNPFKGDSSANSNGSAKE